MHECLDAGSELTVQGGTVQAAERGQSFQPRRHLCWAVGVHGSRPALVSGVQRGEEVDDFSAANLADNDPVRPHAQRLADQLPQRDLPRTFDIRHPGHQPDQVRMLRCEFRCILDADNPFVRGDGAERSGEQRGLARAGSARDQEGQPGGNDGIQQRPGLRRDRPGRRQRGKILGRGPKHPQRQAGSTGGHRRQDGVQPDGEPPAPYTGELSVDPRLGVVEPAAGRRRQPLREPSDLSFITEADIAAAQPVTVIDPDLRR